MLSLLLLLFNYQKCARHHQNCHLTVYSLTVQCLPSCQKCGAVADGLVEHSTGSSFILSLSIDFVSLHI